MDKFFAPVNFKVVLSGTFSEEVEEDNYGAARRLAAQRARLRLQALLLNLPPDVTVEVSIDNSFVTEAPPNAASSRE